MAHTTEMTNEEISFSTPSEIAMELARRAKMIRVNALKINQKDFAKKIGIPYGTYQQFEQKGNIRLEEFILVLMHLGRVKELGGLLKAPDITSLGINSFLDKSSNKKMRARKK